MPLASGTRIGPYEVLAPVGAGGMGEVYRAHDSRLARDVAIKILPPAFTSDPERLARFEREAKILATLNHRNIAAIYGFEDADSTRALVLELVEGDTLAVVSQNSNAAASIWIVDPESATPFRKLAELPVGPRIRGVAWARDGSALIIGQHDTTSDIVLLEQAR